MKGTLLLYYTVWGCEHVSKSTYRNKTDFHQSIHYLFENISLKFRLIFHFYNHIHYLKHNIFIQLLHVNLNQ